MGLKIWFYKFVLDMDIYVCMGMDGLVVALKVFS